MQPPPHRTGELPRPIYRCPHDPRRTGQHTRRTRRRGYDRLAPENLGRADHGFPGGRRQPAPHVFIPRGPKGQPAVKRGAANRQSVGEISHRRPRMRLPPLPQRRHPRPERRGRPRRNHHPMRTRRRRPIGDRGRLLKDRVTIGAGQPDAGNRRAPGMRAIQRPRFRRRREGERPRGRIDRRVQVAKPDLRGHRLVAQRQQ